MSIRTCSGFKKRGEEEEEEEEELPSSSKTATVAAEVCCLPALSVTGTRCTLWTPASFLRLCATPGPLILAEASLSPPLLEEGEGEPLEVGDDDDEEEEEEEEAEEEVDDDSLWSSRHCQPAEAAWRA